MMTFIFCIILILSLFIDIELPWFVYIIAGVMSVNEIAIFLIGYLDGKQDKENRKIYKECRRK